MKVKCLNDYDYVKGWTDYKDDSGLVANIKTGQVLDVHNDNIIDEYGNRICHIDSKDGRNNFEIIKGDDK